MTGLSLSRQIGKLLLRQKQHYRCTGWHKFGALNAEIVDLSEAGRRILVGGTRLGIPATEGELPTTPKKVRSRSVLLLSPLLSYRALLSLLTTLRTIHEPLRAQMPPLRPSQGCKRRGERSSPRGDAVVLHGSGGGGGGRVMSPVDSHDYHLSQLSSLSAYFPSFRPSTPSLSSLRPLGLISTVFLHRCNMPWWGRHWPPCTEHDHTLLSYQV